MKNLSKKQMLLQSQRQIKEYVKNILLPKMLNEVNLELEKKDNPESYYQKNNTSLAMRIIKNNLKSNY